jgi:glycine/D-amino acid oxidase-like deaminating enzyme
VAGRVLVVGAGVFGAASAVALARRGWRVALCDPGPIPHPLAESTDISKIVRLDYGADADYVALMERALDGWRRWNAGWPAPPFHETGVAFLCRAPMAPGGFEHESHRLLTSRGHRLERLDGAAIARRFPAWAQSRYADGYYNPAGGWAESGRVVERLVAVARDLGVTLHAGLRAARLVERDGRVTGVADDEGRALDADEVVVAAGAWTPRLVPSLAGALRPVGQPVFHLYPADPEPFRAERFPVFGADIARTGYYGFPVSASGVVKIANHGVGRPVDPDSASERTVTPEETARLRAFLDETLPRLARAPVVHTRVCVYCDTRDEHFWIARDPERPGLTVAAGGSGHGFKFAPVVGDLVADAVDDVPDAALAKFRWRTDAHPARGEEAARHHGA